MGAFKNILIATDFSESADNATAYGVEMARNMNAKIFLFHAYQISVIPPENVFYTDYWISGLQAEIDESMERTEREYLYQDVPPYEFIIKLGPFKESINNIVKEKNIGLIILGSKGAKSFGTLFGSHITSLINTVECPILSVPLGVKFEGINKIVFACDQGPLEKPLKVLSEFASSFNCSVEVLNVNINPHKIKREEELNTMEIESGLRHVRHTYETAFASEIEEAIETYTHEKKTDILSVVPRKHHLIDKIFSGSISRRLTFHAEVPLLILNTMDDLPPKA